MLLNPMLGNNTSDMELVRVGIKLLKNKFSLQNVTVIPENEHSLQQDGSSCEAYVCCYAKRISKFFQCFFNVPKVFAHAFFDFTQAM